MSEVTETLVVPHDVTDATVGADEGDQLLMSHAAYITSAVVLFFIGFFGFFFNLFVIILMCKDKQLWTPLNVILFNLVCSDFSVSIFGNPFTLASAASRHWIFGPVMCVIYGFFMSLLGITSITTLTVLAFERYMMVSRPFQSQHLTRRNATLMVGGIWTYSLILTTPPLFGWGKYVNEAANISCSVNWEEQTFNTTTYILYLFALGLVVPVSVISFSYINIIRTMKHNTVAKGRVTKAEHRVTHMVAVMIAAFLFAWTPYAILALLTQFGDPTAVTPGMAVVPALVAKSSICYNPLIYIGLNTQFRSSWRHFFGCATPADSECLEVHDTRYGRSKFVSQFTQESVEDKIRDNHMHRNLAVHMQVNKVAAAAKVVLHRSQSNDTFMRNDSVSVMYLDRNKKTVTKLTPNGGKKLNSSLHGGQLTTQI